MFERRPILGLLFGLNVCVIIWRISVLEPAMLDTQTLGGEGYSSDANANSNGNIKVSINGNANANIKLPLADASNDSGNDDDFKSGSSGFPNRGLSQTGEKSPSPFVLNFVRPLYAGKHLLAQHMDNESATQHSVILNKRYQYKTVGSPRQESSANANANADGNGVTDGSGSGVGGFDSPRSDGMIRNGNKSRNGVNPSRSRLRNKTVALASAESNSARATLSTLVTAATLKSLSEDRATATKTSPLPPPPLPLNDFPHLIDLFNFSYQMALPSCKENVHALILVHSAPHNYKKRKMIRETWGSLTSSTSPLQTIFLLGAVKERGLQRKLMVENVKYRDMVQGSFIDDYRNMTYKHVMAFKWFLYNCAHAQILIKVDDDVFLNTKQLLRYLHNTELNSNSLPNATVIATVSGTSSTAIKPNVVESVNDGVSNNSDAITSTDATIIASMSSQQPPHTTTTSQFDAFRKLFNHPHNLMLCEPVRQARVNRSFRSKWRVSLKEYAGKFFPTYCPGYVIMYSADVVLRLYMAAQQYQYFWIDDVHITGVLPQLIGLEVTPTSSYVLSKPMCDHLLAGHIKLHDVEFLYASHAIKSKEITDLWYLQKLTYPSEYNSIPSLHSFLSDTLFIVFALISCAYYQLHLHWVV